MKKFLVIVFTLCMMASVLCITAFAAEPASDVVIRVRAQKKNSDIVEIENGDFKSFADGWEAAVDLATDHTKMDNNNYDYVVVDFYADWKANEEGAFGDDDLDGIENYTIYVPEDTKIVINLNGHTIDRGLGDNNEWDGEVIYVDENARLIINGGKSGDPIVKAGTRPGDIKMGTITGGNSDNGAGGIHVMNGAFVSLNNVHVIGNTTDDDYGAGIALHSGASLVMSGGSISNNSLVGTLGGSKVSGGALYLYNGEATLTNVEIKNNQAYNDYGEGLAIHAIYGAVYLDSCIIDGNGIETDADRSKAGMSIVHIEDATLVATRTQFTNNGAYVDTDDTFRGYSAVIRGENTSYITLEECIFKNNSAGAVIDFHSVSYSASLKATKCDIVDNNSSAFSGYGIITFEDCNFGNNKCIKSGNAAFVIPEYYDGNTDILTFRNCLMGDSTYSYKTNIVFQDANGNVIGSIFSEGSASMVISLAALIVAIAAIGISIASNKKKTALTKAE